MIGAEKSIRQLVSNYRIVEEIHSSSLTSVYQAEHTLFARRPVALKVFHSIALSPHKSEQFLQEAQLLKRLKHPHILPILDVGISDGIPYIVTEYMAKGSLRDHIEQHFPQLLSIQETIALLSQVGKALQYAHQLNITHGNLKPENILLDKNGQALLADLHILTLFDLVSPDAAYNINTLPYLAPEQFQGKTSKESDQYALGSVAYELFTGKLPFFALNFAVMRLKHRTESVAPPTLLNMLLPIHFEKTILKAMAQQEANRYPHMRDFIADLNVLSPVQKPSPLATQALASPISTVGTPSRTRSQVDAKEIAVPPPIQAKNDSKEVSQPVSLAPLSVQEPVTLPPPVDNTLGVGYVMSTPTSFSQRQEVSAQQTMEIVPNGQDKPEDAAPVSSAEASMQGNEPVHQVSPEADALPFAFASLKSSLAKNIPRQSDGKIARPFWWVVLISWGIILIIVLSMFVFILPTLSTQSAPKPTVQKPVLLISPTSIVKGQPTPGTTPKPSPTAKPTIIPTLQPSPSPIVIPPPSPTTTPTPLPSTPLLVTPSHFNGTTDCKFVLSNYFQCSVALELSPTYQNSIRWSAHSNSIPVLFMPSKGMLSPGKPQQVTFYVFTNCPANGSITFTTKAANVTVPWNC
ncbi:MAG: serine/threonine protein kinase [Chloroflexota bacterium]|nr:serine/threonine protein kinase [Chloroflexota bacterium]